MIDKATTNGWLDEQAATNEYTLEIGRVGGLCADYESMYMKFEHIKFKSPLLVSIEKEMGKRHIKQRQTAVLLDAKGSTFSQIMSGKCPISMRMAKRLYKVFNIVPGLILEFSRWDKHEYSITSQKRNGLKNRLKEKRKIIFRGKNG